MPYFKALEDNEAGADHWRGRGGPLHITDKRGRRPSADQALSQGGGQQAGLPLNPDFNGAAQEGVGIYQITTKNGRRMSAARAFLRPAMKRNNRPRRDERAGDQNPVRGQPRRRRRISCRTARRSSRAPAAK